MRFPLLRLLVALPVLAVPACGFFGNHQQEVWVCLDPDSGKESNVDYDPNHYVNGVFDPCNCYDPCGPAPSCPNMIEAGPLPAGCDGGAGAGAGAGGSDGGW